MYHRRGLKQIGPRNPLWIATAGALGGGGGFTWYVDSVNGDDANTGTSPAQAFATIAALESAGISAGDSIGLARGSHWREQFDITVDNVTVAAYGTGNQPLLDASNVAANASFSKTGGQTNVYEISITPEWIALKSWLNVWEDDAYLTRAADLATCDSTPGSYYPSADTGTITLYVHASDSSDVTGNGKIYEYSHRLHSIKCDGSGCRVTSVSTRRNLHEDGSITVKRNGTIVNCTIADGSKHNMLIYDGFTLQNCHFTNAYYAGASAVLLVFNEDTPAGLGGAVSGCTFGSGGAGGDVVNGISGHINTSGNFGDIAVSGCTFDTLLAGISVPNDYSAFSVSGCTFNSCVRSIYIDGDMTISDCDIVAATVTTGVICVDIIGAHTVAISDLRACVENVNSIISSAAACDVSVSDSVIFDPTLTTGQNRRIVTLTNASASLNIQNTVMAGNFRTFYYLSTPNLVSDFNCYDWGAGGPIVMRVNSVNYASFAAYITAVNQDTHSNTTGGCDTSAAPCA